MPNTKKGENTKNTIINVSKKLFLIHGFDNVSLSDICKESNVKLGTLTYYFPKKSDIVKHLYNSYMNKLQEFIDKKTKDKKQSEQYIYMVIFYYYFIYTNKKICKFHYEVMSHSSMNKIFDDTSPIVKPLLEDETNKISKQDFELFVKADNAVRRELNLSFMEQVKEKNIDSIFELIKSIHIVSAKLYNFSNELLFQYLNEGKEFLLKNIKCKISLL